MVLFKDEGPYCGLRTARVLSFNAESFIAILSRTVPPVNKRVWMIAGGSILPHLPDPIKRKLRLFTDEVNAAGAKGNASRTHKYKHFLSEQISESERLGVVHEFGPIPALQLGRVEKGDIVCATPLRSPKSSAQHGVAYDEVVVAEILRTLPACMNTYFYWIADTLASAVFRNPAYLAGDAMRRCHATLAKSVEFKIELVETRGRSVGVTPTVEIEKACDDFRDVLPTWKATAALFRAVMAQLQWCLDGSGDLKELNQLDQAIDNIYFEADKPEFEKCLQQLKTLPDRDELRAIPGRRPESHAHWISDTHMVCLFLAHVKKLIESGYDRRELKIFITYHMDVYANELLVWQLEELAKQQWGGQVRFVTGYGRQSHIMMSILAKMWISDVQLLIVPNSLDTFAGGKKSLKKSNDWVVEEVMNGVFCLKPLHILMATNAEAQGIFALIRDCVSDYDMSSLPESMTLGWIHQIGHANLILEHTRNRIHSKFDPVRREIPKDQIDLLIESILKPAAKIRLASMAAGQRYRLSKNDRKILDKILDACRPGTEGSRVGISTTEIVQQLSAGQKGDHRDRYSTIAKALRERILRLRVCVNGEFIPVIIRSRRRGEYYYMFNIGPIVNRFSQSYTHLSPLTELTQAFWDGIREGDVK